MRGRSVNTRGLVVKTGEGSAGSGSREAGNNSSMGRLACLCTGVASLLLMLVALVLQLVEGSWFPLLANAAALVLQAVCGAILWRNSTQKTCPGLSWSPGEPKAHGGPAQPSPSASPRQPHQNRSDGTLSWSDVESKHTGLGVAAMEQGAGGGGSYNPKSGGVRSTRKILETSQARSTRRVAAGPEGEESSEKQFGLETPLQQVARILEFVLDEYSPDGRTRDKLETVLDIISLPEDLNTVTIQSIMNADLDSSTTEWIEAQLSSGAMGVESSKSGKDWGRLRAGLSGVVNRLAVELSGDQRDTSEADTGMTSEQLRRQKEVGRAYNMEKAASTRSMRRNTNMNVSQLMTLPGARVASTTLYEVDECSQESAGEENTEQQALLELMPVWPGIEPEAQKSLVDLLTAKHFLDWGFDVFKLEELSGGHALWYTGMLTLYHYNFVGVFSINPANLSRFLMHIEHNYCFDPAAPNPYHTSLHAADVTLTVAHFCENSIVSSGIKALQGFALLVSAIVHDYRHRGVNNGFLTKSKDSLAITYNDASVLENFHIAEAFKIIYDDRTDILSGLTIDDMRNFRQFVIKIILATDLAHGFEYVARFKASTNTKGGRRPSIVPHMARDGAKGSGVPGFGAGGGTSAAKGGAQGKDPLQAQILLMQMVLKVADVAHPMRPWDLHARWTKLITEEFHRQGDLEAEQGFPISPLCGREGHNQAKSQCDFVNFVVRPCATVFSEFCKDKVWVNTLESNYRRWSDMT